MPEEKFKKNIRELIQTALITFSADGIGKKDLALQTSGSSIYSASNTAYTEEDTIFSKKKVYGKPAATILNIVHGLGDCWSMEGTSGFVIVKLAKPTKIFYVSLDHISTLVAHDISSAPKAFEVYGYENEQQIDGNKGDLLVSGEYNANSSPIQSFFYQIHKTKIIYTSNWKYFQTMEIANTLVFTD